MSITIPKIRPITVRIGSQCNTAKKSGLSNSPSFCGGLKPPVEIKNPKIIDTINWIGNNFDSAMQRFVAGVTALFTQPFFDYYNKDTDEKTRKTSTARTLGKIIAGTLTGVTIRELCIQATKYFTKNENIYKEEIERFNRAASKKGKPLKILDSTKKFSKLEQLLLPEAFKKTAAAQQIKYYRGTIGTCAAVIIMIFTNFLVDAPLTTYLTNIFVKKFNQEDPDALEKTPIEGGKK